MHYAASHVNRYLEFLWSLFAKFGCCLHYQPFHRQWRKHNGGFCNGLLSSRVPLNYLTCYQVSHWLARGLHAALLINY